MNEDQADRYSRQIRLPQIGELNNFNFLLLCWLRLLTFNQFIQKKIFIILETRI